MPERRKSASPSCVSPTSTPRGITNPRFLIGDALDFLQLRQDEGGLSASAVAVVSARSGVVGSAPMMRNSYSGSDFFGVSFTATAPGTAPCAADAVKSRVMSPLRGQEQAPANRPRRRGNGPDDDLLVLGDGEQIFWPSDTNSLRSGFV